jgi:[pyruvate, water dikinase]-phosphate phosphotransferase / [pyruvate, water dikinase] kinase
MWKSRDVYYVSGNTGILAKNMGKALLAQFPDITFNEELIPFIRTEEEARAALGKILTQSCGRSPIVLSTLFIKHFNDLFNTPEIEFLNICDNFLGQLEKILEIKALRAPGFSRILDDTTMTKRVNAIQFSISHDDGTSMQDYDQADIILVGVSRSGKTPVSVYLATQMGVKTANYPLVDDDLNRLQLPTEVVRNIQRIAGLSTSPQMLHMFRENRYQGSRYADLSTCMRELNQAREIFRKYSIPVIFSDGRSIEETATQITQALQLNVATTF